MVNAYTFQNNYIELYKQVRKYIWPLHVIQNLVDLEIETYKKFPDLDSLRNIFKKFKESLGHVPDEDEDLEKALNVFEESLDDESVYSDLYKVAEVIQVEDN